jgi:hypothetical protein
MSEDIRRAQALVDELGDVLRRHGLDAESALGCLARVVGTQITSFLMGDALAASGTTLDRDALLQNARNELVRFSNAVLANITASLPGASQ